MNNPGPFDTVIQIAGGYCVSRCLHVVADLGVADEVDESPRAVSDIAAAVGADPGALRRILRLLSAHGVFEIRGDSVSHTPASRLLRSDHPQSMRGLARMLGLPINWASFGALGHAARTGQPVTDRIHPGGLWAYYSEHPEAGAIFNAAMTGKAHGQIAGILAAYDFSAFDCIADIGGGSGHLLRAVLDGAPAARGVLFDLPPVIEQAAAMASDRLMLKAGDFFTDPLPACDAYLLMEVVHDWADRESRAILEAIRRAAPAGARLLLIEALIPDEPGPDWSKMLDIHMLALLGGRQRTRKEYETLLDDAGFRLQREIETRAGISILEATVA